MKSKSMIAYVAAATLSLGLMTAVAEEAPRRGLQRGDCPNEECTGEGQLREKSRQGLRQGDRAGDQGRGQGRERGAQRQGEGRGRAHHRDGTGARR